MNRDDAALNKLITRLGVQPLMSNTKWVKLMKAIVDNAELIKECQVKLIWDDGAAERRLMFDENTSYNFDYYATSMEGMITGKYKGSTGWHTYQEIEWLDFPRFISDKFELQDLSSIQQQIQRLGQFHLELSGDNLRLYAYLRP